VGYQGWVSRPAGSFTLRPLMDNSAPVVTLQRAVQSHWAASRRRPLHPRHGRYHADVMISFLLVAAALTAGSLLIGKAGEWIDQKIGRWWIGGLISLLTGNRRPDLDNHDCPGGRQAVRRRMSTNAAVGRLYSGGRLSEEPAPWQGYEPARGHANPGDVATCAARPPVTLRCRP
jgi:hypothetical protein